MVDSETDRNQGITPSIFEEWATTSTVVDEYTLCQTLGKTEALARLQTHWDTWITQEDFTEIASLGLNHVRIPIGYWSVSPIVGDPYVQGAYAVLAKALDWAETAGLKVMIDLHGGQCLEMFTSGRILLTDYTN